MRATTTRLGTYELVDRFATGGAAEVYRARDTRDGRLVAVKRLRQDLPFDPEVSGGFLREVQLAMRSDHPNLIRGLDRGSVGGSDYVVLEYVPGRDLEALRLRARERGVDVPTRFWLFVVRELLSGLEFAHEMTDDAGEHLGLVHRDIKPENVLISFDGQVKVADFGAAVATFQEPMPEEVVGTAGFMAPEQASLHMIDRRSDIYSTGCLLYTLVTGAVPFDVSGKRDSAVLRAHQRGDFKPLPTDTDDRLRMVIEIAMSLHPEERYRDAVAMRVAVDELIGYRGQPKFRALLAKGIRQLFADDYKASQI